MSAPLLKIAAATLIGIAALGASLSLQIKLVTQTSDLPVFRNITRAAKLDFVSDSSPTSRKYLPESMVGGSAMFDYDNDGRLDLFFVNGAKLLDPMSASSVPDKSEPKYWNRLYRNNGDGTFTDVTEKAGLKGEGYGMGVAIGDYDNDGYEDIYVTSVGGNSLYHNNGDGTFTDVAKQAGVAGGGWSTGAMFIDYDRDGRLDLFVSRYLTWDFSKDVFCGLAKPGYRAYCHPDQFPPITHLLFHNEGDGRFRDVSEESGIAKSPGKGLGVAFNDYDRDGWPDIMVANDSVAQQLFHNLGNGKFEEVGLQTGVAFDEDGNALSGMGLDFADFENAGWPSIFVDALAKQKYGLFRNRKGAFEYVSGPAGVGAASVAHSGWGAKFIDYDNDGRKDLFIAQGHVMDNIQLTQPDVRYLEAPMLLRNVPPLFADVSRQSGVAFLKPFAARGAAFGYLGNNGQLAIAINVKDESAVLIEASPSANHWLTISLAGTRSNRDGLGTQAHLVAADGTQQFGLASTAGSYLSSSDKRIHFGLGKNTSVKELEIAWPSGIHQSIQNILADQLLVVREPTQ